MISTTENDRLPRPATSGFDALRFFAVLAAGIAVFLLVIAATVGSTHAGTKQSRPSGQLVDQGDPGDIAVIIGNSDYGDHVLHAPFAGNDARAMAMFAEDILSIPKDRILLIEDAGQSELFALFGNRVSHKGKLHNLAAQTGGNVLVFYSGHGVPGALDARAYLLPVDGDPLTPEITGYGVDVLFHNLAKLNARSVTVFMDTGFTGDTPMGRLTDRAPETPVTAVPFGLPDGISVLTAAQPGETALWYQDQSHSLFTEYLLRGLYGSADVWDFGNGDGHVSLAELKKFMDIEMSPVAEQQFGARQIVDVSGATDLVLARLDLDNPPLRPLVATRQVDTVAAQTIPSPQPSLEIASTASEEAAKQDRAAAREIERLRQELSDMQAELEAREEEAEQALADIQRAEAEEDEEEEREREALRDAQEELEEREEDYARLEEALEEAEAELDRFMADPQEQALWEEVRESRDPEDLKVYILSYPEGRYVDIAKLRLAKITRAIANRRLNTTARGWTPARNADQWRREGRRPLTRPRDQRYQRGNGPRNQWRPAQGGRPNWY